MNKPEIYYLFDPLCGWCYAFSPVINRLYNDYNSTADFKVISGGMVLGEMVRPIGKISEYILNTIPRLEELSGQKMGDPYKQMLKEGTAVYGSERPSIAIEVVKYLNPEISFSFVKDMQHQHFYEGKIMEHDDFYLPLLAKYQLPEKAFFDRLNSFEFKTSTYDGFRFSNELGIRGFPSVVGKKNDQYYLLSNGFRDYDSMKNNVDLFLQ
ncbi:MAG: DsbA family protein [Flavobacteriales bacterium]|nr:DsbA family protein [Flavobacteriales bacterium]